MGDVIHGLPAVAALRAAFPEAMMGWLIEERWAELLCTLPTPRSGPRSPQRPLVDRIHTVNTRQWRAAPFSVANLGTDRGGLERSAGGAIRSCRRSSGRGALVVAGAVVGSAGDLRSRPSLAKIWPACFTRARSSPRGEHVVEQNLSLVEACCAGRLEIPARVELPADDSRRAGV